MGYEIDRFSDPNLIDESFKCGICLEVFSDPVMIRRCEHMYCRDCITDWTRTNNVCPEDRTPIRDSDIVQPPRMIRNLHGNLKIKCEFFKVGCKQVMPLTSLASHLEECGFNNTECSNCGFKGFQSHDCMKHLIAKNKALEMELESRKNPNLQKIRDDCIKEAKEAIEELWRKSSLKEGITKLLQQFPAFKLPFSRRDATFAQYFYKGREFDEKEREILLQIVLRAIAELPEEQVEKDLTAFQVLTKAILNKILSTDLVKNQDEWNVTVYQWPFSASFFHFTKVVYFGIGNLYIGIIFLKQYAVLAK